LRKKVKMKKRRRMKRRASDVGYRLLKIASYSVSLW